MYDRFTEMEELGFEVHFRLAAYKLIRRARKHSKGLVGRDLPYRRQPDVAKAGAGAGGG